ncbi:hypothetical protein V6N13_041926 [Hibiscus sabdariffa]
MKVGEVLSRETGNWGLEALVVQFLKWVKSCLVAYGYGSYPWLPLLGPWGGVSYAPAMVQRQFGEKQFVPTTHELSELEFSYKEKGAIALVKEIAEAWKQEWKRLRERFAKESCGAVKGFPLGFPASLVLTPLTRPLSLRSISLVPFLPNGLRPKAHSRKQASSERPFLEFYLALIADCNSNRQIRK